MIEWKISPPQILHGIASEINLEIRNRSNGSITHFLLDLQLPVKLLLIKGSRQIELSRLDPQKSYFHSLIVRGREPGRHLIQLQGLSYRGPDGKTYSITDESLPLEVISQDQEVLSEEVQLTVSLNETSLILNEWCQIDGWVNNLSVIPVQGLKLGIDGPLITEPITLDRVEPHGRIPFVMSVFPSQAGESVPTRIKIQSPSGAILLTERVQLKVFGNRSDAGVKRDKSKIKTSLKNETQSEDIGINPVKRSDSPAINMTTDGSPIKLNTPLRVFLCHSSSDKPFVRDLYKRLKRVKSITCEPWLDEVDILPGEDWDSVIKKAVKTSHVVLVCISKSSINKEGYIQKEVRLALDIALEKPDGTIYIIPIRLDECDVPEKLKTWQYVDCFGKQWFDRLVLALEKRAATLNQ